MKQIPGITVFALALLACDISSPADPIAAGYPRLDVVQKLPEGTEVIVSLPGHTAVGSTFLVKRIDKGEGAFCRTSAYPTVPDIHLHEITLVGGGAPDPEGYRGITSMFSTPMPTGTLFEVTGVYIPLAHCASNYLYRAVVVNGS